MGRGHGITRAEKAGGCRHFPTLHTTVALILVFSECTKLITTVINATEEENQKKQPPRVSPTSAAPRECTHPTAQTRIKTVSTPLASTFETVNVKIIYYARCLYNLSQHEPVKPNLKFPNSRKAAVLVALFVGRHGDLYVLLSQ